MTERRVAPRFQVRQMIAYQPGREEYLWAEGVDLSREGIHCRASEPVDPLTNLYLMLEVPVNGGVRTIHCEGFVARSARVEGGCDFAVRFQQISEGDRAYLETYLSNLERQAEAGA